MQPKFKNVFAKIKAKTATHPKYATLPAKETLSGHLSASSLGQYCVYERSQALERIK